MPDETNSGAAPAAAGGAPDASGGTPPAAEGGAGAAPAGGGGQPVTVPSSAMKRIKEEQYNRGITDGMAKYARDAGFESPEDMAAFLKNLKTQASTPPKPPAAQAGTPKPPTEGIEGEEGLSPEELSKSRQDRRIQGRYERQMEKLMRERDLYQRKSVELERVTKQLQTSLDSKDAEMALRETAVASGLKDVDYGIRLLTRHLEGQSAEELEKFDEKAFFDTLRKDKPYLFGEVTQPATTGTGVGGAPTPLKPGAAAGQVANGAHSDARKMNAQEFQEHLRKRGLNANQ